MRYPAAVKYLFSFLNYERVPFEYERALNLKRMARVLGWAQHPERRYPSILVAGTKGKGSTANFISSILSNSGYHTGLFTSPHLTDPRERIRINSKIISRREFAEAVTRVFRILRKHRGGATPYGTLTFFEVFTLAAMIYFAKKNVDIAVFEVGMGGRLDATNVLNPLLSVITPVSFDHEEHLGRTLSKIAGEKAAIIKKNTPVIIGLQKSEAKRVILTAARRMRSPAYLFGRDFTAARIRSGLNGSRFDFRMGHLKLKNLFIKLPGAFQVQNAACAIAAVGAAELPVPEDNACLKGLKQAFWPGRFEIVKRGERTYILDGAHNGASAEALAGALKRLFPRRQIIFILGVSREKDLKAILAPLVPIGSSFIMAKSANPRAQEPKIMLEALYDMGFQRNSFWADGLKEALELGRKIAARREILVITGSLFLIGEARKLLKCQPLL